MTRPDPDPKIPAVSRAPREPLSSREQIYIAVLRHWYRYRGRAPSCMEIANLCKPRRSYGAIRAAFLSAEDKGYLRRNTDGRFEVIE